MKLKTVLDGYDLKNMFTAGADWLEKIVPEINALNVFPVPDGDTGTNMLLTIRASLEAASSSDGSAAAVAHAIDRGALMGARGNSGVILSQILHGVAEELKDKNTINGEDLARALQRASDTAYLALSNPVEGTILTVIRDAASAANKAIFNDGTSAIPVLTAAVHAARASVMETPNLLQVLKEAGVVDAGGHGLYTFLEGALINISGNNDNRLPELLSTGRPLVARVNEFSHEDDFYGFCTQFMVSGQNLKAADLREALETHGKSLIVIGDDSTLRVHIHTHNAESAIRAASLFGTITDIDIRDMDEQHQDFLLIKQNKPCNLNTAVIAVVNGPGMVNVFADLGVAAIVPGGQTMNPSTMDILHTVETVNSNNIIILPNNKNVISTALLVQSLTKKKLKIIPTKTIPQGISAMVEYVPETDYETNVKKMSANITTVKTIEITKAISSVKLNKLNIKQGQFIGLLDGELLVTSKTADDAIFQLFDIIDLAKSQLVTLYFGKETDKISAERIGSRILECYPHLELGIVNGEQPNYQYIISVE